MQLPPDDLADAHIVIIVNHRRGDQAYVTVRMCADVTNDEIEEALRMCADQLPQGERG